MDKTTSEDKPDKTTQLDVETNKTAKSLRAKSEYSAQDKRNITIGLITMTLLFFSALIVLIAHIDNNPVQTTDESVIEQSAHQLDKIELREVTIDYYAMQDSFIVRFSEDIDHFVPVRVSEDRIYAANFVPKETAESVDYEELREELRVELLGPEYISYQPEKTEISQTDATNGVSRYYSGDDYCTLQISTENSLYDSSTLERSSSMDSDTQAAGYVVKVCADRQELQIQASEIEPFYTIIDADQQGSSDEYSTSILYLDSGVQLSPVDGYEYKHGTLATVGTTESTRIYFARFEQDDWVKFSHDSSGIINCDDFNTPVIRNALAGEVCLDVPNEQELLVGEYYNLL